MISRRSRRWAGGGAGGVGADVIPLDDVVLGLRAGEYRPHVPSCRDDVAAAAVVPPIVLPLAPAWMITPVLPLPREFTLRAREDGPGRAAKLAVCRIE